MTALMDTTGKDPARPPVVTKLRGIEQFQSLTTKPWDWSKNFLCLKIRRCNKDEPRLVLEHHPRATLGHFIAVSYSWKSIMMAETGKYCILDGQNMFIRQSQVSDQILTRTISYAEHHNIGSIWIDQECIPQADEQEIQNSIDSMHHVYRKSKLPLALLETVLEKQDEVDILESLLRGTLVETEARDRGPPFTPRAFYPNLVAAVELLSRISKDSWWLRAWILQEEYLSSVRMDLLIRRGSGTTVSPEFGSIPGEFCVAATDFRAMVTWFLLAIEGGQFYPSDMRKKIEMLLQQFRKYNILYSVDRDLMRKPPSATIIADILRRNITRPFDFLSITANLCDYSIRIRPEQILEASYPVQLCLLAQMLLNGEILKPSSLIDKRPDEMSFIDKRPDKMSFIEYQQHIFFDEFSPPVCGKHFTFLKSCRLNNVSFCDLGIRTEGHLWEIVHDLPKIRRRKSLGRRSKFRTDSLNEYQKFSMEQLILVLKRLRRYDSLIRNIEDLINSRIHSPAKEYMYLMVDSIVEAIRTGTPLCIAREIGKLQAGGIFVGRGSSKMSIFTSWSAGFEEDDRWRRRHVSLGVKIIESTNMHEPPLVDSNQWINGLVFFKQSDSREVIFRWPEVWL